MWCRPGGRRSDQIRGWGSDHPRLISWVFQDTMIALTSIMYFLYSQNGFSWRKFKYIQCKSQHKDIVLFTSDK